LILHRHLAEWEISMRRFREEIIQIEDMAKHFIDVSFKKLRSAEGAFDLLQNIKNIKSRDAINKQLMGKWHEILDQYGREIEIINEIFVKNKNSPPCAKNQPKLAGSIAWCHSLFERIKKTIVRFQSLPEMMSSDLGVTVTKKYLAVAKSMRHYEEQLYQQWFNSVEGNCLSYLKCHILAKDPKDVSQESIIVNFRPELLEVIKETKYLDKMGMLSPEAALNVTLQEDKYYHLCQTLSTMIKSYNAVIDPMDVAERKLFVSHIAELNRVMRPGFARLNWNSLGVPDFIQKCNLEIKRLSSLLTQTRKNSSSISRVIRKIASAQLILEPPSDVLLDPYEYFEMTNSHRITVLDGLVVNYNSIGPLLMKTESLVASSNSGSSKTLKEYYSFWERKIFHAITYMVTNNLSILEGFLSFGSKRKTNTKTTRVVPLFKVNAILSVPEILISPTPVDLHKLIFKLVRSVVDSSRLFYRWLNGTCIIAPPQKIADDSEMFSFTFFNDLSANGNVISLINAINNALAKTFQKVNDWVDVWRKYRPLWKVDKLVTLDKFSQKKPTPVQYDEKLVFYSKLANDVQSQHSVRNVDFVQIIADSLQNSIHREAISWVTCIGKNLNTVCLESMVQLESKFAKLEKDLSCKTDTPEDQNFAKEAILEIRNSSDEIELKVLDIIESYRTLKMYKLVVEAGEYERCDDLFSKLEKVRAEAKICVTKMLDESK
jgi:dynein heavy chain, axonemal